MFGSVRLRQVTEMLPLRFRRQRSRHFTAHAGPYFVFTTQTSVLVKKQFSAALGQGLVVI